MCDSLTQRAEKERKTCGADTHIASREGGAKESIGSSWGGAEPGGSSWGEFRPS